MTRTEERNLSLFLIIFLFATFAAAEAGAVIGRDINKTRRDAVQDCATEGDTTFVAALHRAGNSG